MTRTGVRAKLPVICVGNFILGGAGKTPAAIMLARMLSEMGERPFFLTRGYGGSARGPKLVDPDTAVAADFGDEALLLARVAPTVVAKDRISGAAFAREHGATTVVLDDGLQNPTLEKDFTLAVIDANHGIGNACVFPAGPLRAPLSAQLAQTNVILVVGEGRSADHTLTQARAGALPILHGRLVADRAITSTLKDHAVLAFAGIGHPEKFLATVMESGIAVKEYRLFPDHHRFTAGEAKELIAKAEHAGLMLLTTEKDRARMIGEKALDELAARVRTLPVTMVLKSPEELRRLMEQNIRR